MILFKNSDPDVILNTYPIYQSALHAVFAITKHRIPMLTVITDISTIHRLWFYENVDGCLVPNDHVRDLALESNIPLKNNLHHRHPGSSQLITAR